MTILVQKSTRTVLSGIESSLARFQVGEMLRHGTNLVGIVGRPGSTLGELGKNSLPIFADWQAAAAETSATFAMVFDPPLGVKQAITDALGAGFTVVVCLTEHVPVHDALELRERARAQGAVLLGPNSAGLLAPGVAKAGYFTEDVCKPGRVGVLTKGGSVAYAVMTEMKNFGMGVSTVVSIGGDAARGACFRDLLPLLEADEDTDAIVLLGEIGGDAEERAADVARGLRKPVAALISGRSVPAGATMGHAGAIAGQGRGDYHSKVAALRAAGVHVAEHVGGIVEFLSSVHLNPRNDEKGWRER